MKKNLIYLSIVCLLGISACSEEDALVAEYDNRSSYYLPDESAMDEISVLRRLFYEQENCYLLFTDTIQKKPLGTDRDGYMQYFIETIDIDYNVGSSTSSTYTYTYDYLNSVEEKKAAVAFMKEYLLSHLSSTLRPYSWFVVKNITRSNWQGETNPLIVTGERCFAVAVGDEIASNTNEEKESLGMSILQSAVGIILSKKDSEMAPFFAVCDGLYENSFSTDYTEEGNMESLLQAGFLCKGLFWGIIEAYGIYPSKSQDLNSYTSLLLGTPEEEVIEKYGNYPLVMEKYNILKDLITKVGYIY